MKDTDKTKAQLLEELARLRRRVAKLKAAKLQRKQSELRYRLLAENVTDVIWTMDLDLHLTDVTPSVTALLGYSVQEALSNTIHDILTPASLQAARQLIAQEMAPARRRSTRDSFWWRMLELEHICKDGSTLWAEVKLSFLRDENDKPIGILGITRDITERKLAQDALVRRAREMAALYETALEINSQLDLHTLLHAIVRRAADLLGAHMGGLYLMTPDNAALELVINHNLPGAYLGARLCLGEGLSGRIAQTGEPLMVADYQNWEGRASIYTNVPMCRVLGVPLKRRGQVIGVINVADDEKTDLFSEDQVRMVSLFADQAAIAVENARLYDAIQRELAERKQAEQAEREQRALAEALRDAAAALASTLSLDQVLERILTRVGRVVPHDAGNIMLVEQDTACVARAQGYDEYGSAQWILTVRYPIAQTANLRYMLETGQPMVIPDVQNFPGWVDVPESRWMRSYVSTPIRVKGQVIGFLNLDSAIPGFFAQAHAERLRAFADQAGIAIENARLFEAEQQRRQELEAVYQASLSLTASLELPLVLDAILSTVINMIPVQDAHIFLYDNDRLTFGAAKMPRGEMTSLFSELRPDGLTYAVARSGQAVVVEDSSQHPLFADVRAKWPPFAIIGLPLKIASTVVGVMNVAFTQPRRFAQSILRLLDLLAAQAAIAVQNARLYEAAQRELAERKQAEEALRYRVELEKLVSNISTNFVNLPSAEIDTAILKSLEAIGAFIGVDRSYVFQFSKDRTTVSNTHEWCAQGIQPQAGRLQKLPASLTPWSVQKLSRFETIYVPRATDLPVEASAEKELFQAQGILSLVLVPLVYGNTLVGFMGLDSVRAEQVWADEDIALLKTVGEVFINALERKRIDEALRRHAVELQARNEELDTFAHTVAHDLKNPLGPLTGFAEVLETDYATLSDDERKRSCRYVAQNARKMADIIEELLLLARVRKMDVEHTLLDMTSIVAEAQQRLGDLIATFQAEIVLPDAWPPVWGHAPWVEEVWVNYMSNALKYGGRPPRVELGADTLPGGMVRLWVRDNGAGLTPEDQARLFTPFTRLDRARARGHGLGLSIVRRIVDKLGGQVSVASEGVPGRGSTFYFTLPGADPHLRGEGQ